MNPKSARDRSNPSSSLSDPSPRRGPAEASAELLIRNRQRGWHVDAARMGRFVATLLEGELRQEHWQLGVHLVSGQQMARLNARWLGHDGSTDVLTFDHRQGMDEGLHGEIFISIDDAATQARDFGTGTAEELVRYLVHGVLHLVGHDDREPAGRRAMKRVENRLVQRLLARMSVRGLVSRRQRGR